MLAARLGLSVQFHTNINKHASLCVEDAKRRSAYARVITLMRADVTHPCSNTLAGAGSNTNAHQLHPPVLPMNSVYDFMFGMASGILSEVRTLYIRTPCN